MPSLISVRTTLELATLFWVDMLHEKENVSCNDHIIFHIVASLKTMRFHCGGLIEIKVNKSVEMRVIIHVRHGNILFRSS